MGLEHSGHRATKEELRELRQAYLDTNRSCEKVSEMLGFAAVTVRVYRDKHKWDEWCDKVTAKADELSVVPQAKRIATILNLYDQRLEAIKDAVKDPEVYGSVAREISEIAKSSQLLTGGATGRMDIRAALDQFERLSIDDQRKLLEERSDDDSTP